MNLTPALAIVQIQIDFNPSLVCMVTNCFEFDSIHDNSHKFIISSHTDMPNSGYI